MGMPCRRLVTMRKATTGSSVTAGARRGEKMASFGSNMERMCAASLIRPQSFQWRRLRSWVRAKALGVTVFSHKGDACKAETIKLPAGAGEIDMKGFACPLSKGDVELDLDIKLASTIPAKLARTTIDLKATTSTGDKVLCVQIKTAPAESIVV